MPAGVLAASYIASVYTITGRRFLRFFPKKNLRPGKAGRSCTKNLSASCTQSGRGSSSFLLPLRCCHARRAESGARPTRPHAPELAVYSTLPQRLAQTPDGNLSERRMALIAATILSTRPGLGSIWALPLT